MRRLVERIEAGATVLAVALTLAASTLLVLEKTDQLGSLLLARANRAFESLGLEMTSARVVLRWFEPAVELYDVRVTDPNGETAFATDTLRVVLRPFGPAPFVDRVEVGGGELVWDESAWLASSEPSEDPPSWIEDEASWPELRVSELRVEARLGALGVFRLGRVDVRLQQTDAGPKIDGAWLPPESDTPVAITGRVPPGAPIEIAATALGLDPTTLPAGNLGATIEAWQPSGRADLHVTVQVPRTDEVRPIVDSRLRLRDGALRVPETSIELAGIELDVEASYDPGQAPPYAVEADAVARWNEAALDASVRAGSAAGPGREVHAGLRAANVPATRESLASLPLDGFVDPLYPALRPNGTANAAVDVAWESLEQDPEAFVAIESSGETSVAWHGFVSSTSGERVGFPMRVDSARGRVLITDHPRCDRRTRVALVDLGGRAASSEGPGASVVAGEGIIVSPPRAFDQRSPELDLWFEGDGLTADANAADGLAGLVDADWIWPEFQPAGGTLSATARIVLMRDRADPRVAVNVTGRDVGFRWRRIPMPVTSNRLALSLFFDGRGGFGLETSTIGSTGTVDELEVAASLLIDPAERARGRDEVEALQSAFRIAARNVPLRGDDASILYDSLEWLGDALAEIDAKGKTDVSVDLIQPLPGQDMQLAVTVEPRQVELTPAEFPVVTREVRGRVLATSDFPNPFEEDADEGRGTIRFAPLVGEFAGGARVAAQGAITRGVSDRFEIHGAGLRPGDRNFSAAVARAIGRTPGAGSPVELAGRVDASVDLANLPDGTDRFELRARLRRNDLFVAGEGAPLLRGMNGVIIGTRDELACSELDAILGSTPVRLTDTRLVPGADGGVRIETDLTADALPLDREHLRWFMDAETLDNLVDELDFRGTIDVEGAELDLEQRPEGDLRIRFRGRTVLSDLFLRVGLPVSIRSGYADVEKLIFENGRVRAWARMHDLYARIAGRNLDAASMLVTYHAPRLNILTLDGWFAGGRAQGLRTESSRTGPVVSLDLIEPFRFELGTSLVAVEVEELLDDLFDSAIASDGLLTADLRLAGNLEDLLAMRGSGSGRVEKARLWSLPVVRVILSALGAGNTVVFDEVYSRFQIEDGRITMSDIKVMSPLLQLIGYGTLDLDGRIDYELQVRYGLVDRLGPLTRLIYWIQNNLISIAVRGDMSRPRVVFLGLLGVLSLGVDDELEREMPLPPLSPLQERF